MTSITVFAPIQVAAPRATQWAADTFVAFLGWFSALRALRAAQRLQAERATEARAVRSYAHRYASQDPRFAADLLAAADRHQEGK